MIAKLGNYVLIEGHGSRIGRVYAKHHNFSTVGGSQSWFDLQNLPESAKEETWYSILMDTGGAISVPEYKIIEILAAPPQFFTNPWEGFYF